MTTKTLTAVAFVTALGISGQSYAQDILPPQEADNLSEASSRCRQTVKLGLNDFCVSLRELWLEDANAQGRCLDTALTLGMQPKQDYLGYASSCLAAVASDTHRKFTALKYSVKP